MTSYGVEAEVNAREIVGASAFLAGCLILGYAVGHVLTRWAMKR